MADPTITVTSLGDQGVDEVHGVIYPPQVALVGIGRIANRPVAVDGLIGVHPVVRMTLAGDHRATDGHTGARFLATIEQAAATTGGAMDARTAVIASLAVIAPEADFESLAPDADLRDELDLDSMDFLNFVIGVHDRTGSRGARARLPQDADPRRVRRAISTRRSPRDDCDRRTPWSSIRWLDDIKKDDTALVGGKGANLGELRRAGFPVPDGFVVTADAYVATVGDETERWTIVRGDRRRSRGARSGEQERCRPSSPP